MKDRDNKVEFNQWISMPISMEEIQLFQKTISSDLKGKNGPEDTSEKIKVAAIPIGALLANEKGGLLEFAILIKSKKGECQDRFTTQLTSFHRSSEDILKILWMGAAHRMSYSVAKCMRSESGPELTAITRHSFYPSFNAFPYAYMLNMFTTQPEFLTVNYYETLEEGVAKLPATIQYSFCSRLANAPSGAVRCVATQTNITPPIPWKDHIRKPTLAELNKEASLD